jgi:hypothetical protein
MYSISAVMLHLCCFEFEPLAPALEELLAIALWDADRMHARLVAEAVQEAR